MNNSGLEQAYRRLTTAAQAINPARLSDGDRQQLDWTLAHLALSDPLLIQAAHQVLAGESPLIDNSPAMDQTAIDHLIATTSHQERVCLIGNNGGDLV